MILQICITLTLMFELDASGVVSFDNNKISCCLDNGQCCPLGTTCDFEKRRCVNSKFSSTNNIDELHYLHPIRINNNRSSVLQEKFEKYCLDNHFKCPGQKKCCPIENKGFGCCKFDRGVCCPDLKTCCPHGTECDIQKGACMTKSSNITPLLNINTPETCPDKSTECTTSESCCYVGYNSYGCCPFKHATCCSDNATCCPQNKKCDLVKKLCVPKESPSITFVERKSLIRFPKNVRFKNICLDRTQCQTNHTCCHVGEHVTGCCPYVKGVCCPDQSTCCNQGFRCYGNGCEKVNV